MQRDPRAWLWDVREAALAIRTFVSGLDQFGYANSELVHSAVERKFEVIGEALNQLSKAEPVMAAHPTVWNVIQSSLPALQDSVAQLLKELDARA